MTKEQVNMENLVIPGEVLEKAEISGSDLLIEIAVYLYGKERLSIGQAKDLAGLDLVSFQKELAGQEGRLPPLRYKRLLFRFGEPGGAGQIMEVHDTSLK